MRAHNRSTETAQEVSGAFRIGLQKVMQLKQEAHGLKKMVRDLKLADEGLDTRYALNQGLINSKREAFGCRHV